MTDLAPGLARRYQLLPPYSYCTEPDCGWQQSDGGHATEDAAQVHATTAGHQVRHVRTQQVILTPEKVTADV